MEGITVKKLLQAVLCLLLSAVLPACGLSSFAEDEGELTCGDYAYQLLEDGSARITAYTGDATELAVPAELDGHPDVYKRQAPRSMRSFTHTANSRWLSGGW